jgi:hypothetical protein
MRLNAYTMRRNDSGLLFATSYDDMMLLLLLLLINLYFFESQGLVDRSMFSKL